MQLTADRAAAPPSRFTFDRLGLVIALIIIAAILFQPFALVRPNRVAATAPVYIWNALPLAQALVLIALTLGTALIMALRSKLALRLGILVITLIVIAIAIGWSATYLTPAGNNYARVSPGGGLWLIVFALALAIGDTLVRLNLKPLPRLAALGIFVLLLGVFLYSGVWSDISILKEYVSRRSAFASAISTHAFLAVGSLIAAFIIATPIGIIVHRFKRIRDAVLSFFNVIQTIPSMALFGVLIAPLAWVGANLPGAAALGIAGIGPAPAFIALVAYALLPIVSATVTGLDNVSPSVVDAARGVGMTRRQRLFSVELPLAFPVILTGIRIVLVQNIGLAVIAGLVGGGGLGMFVFQGIAQTATDLVLLGALPTVAMAFVAAILLDALIEISRGHQN
ncbi:ABC transporter permease [Brucella rhizosphaerae]|uniref:Binding-protein-dependent transport system inner membrane component family protein n=1 Tax=Brucella rhizosphaerae TaxID=571254 RepID=A0A256FV70_9HYPH|nr:ABC transporter permease [Brucella rhizosphaerae]OYR18616.1 binding-protein-dependent transport system inner membrane component family protein [Brucella rhizosphaerae]